MLQYFHLFLSDVQQTLEVYFKLDAAQIGQIRAKFLQPLLLAAGFLFLLFIVVTLYLSVTYTHKFYGPLVSINRFLDELNEGKNPEPIQLRTNDQLQDLAERLNRLSQPQGKKISFPASSACTLAPNTSILDTWQDQGFTKHPDKTIVCYRSVGTSYAI